MFSTLKLLVSIYLLLWVNCYCSIKLFPIKFSQEGIKSGCALFLFIPSEENPGTLKMCYFGLNGKESLSNPTFQKKGLLDQSNSCVSASFPP